MCKSLRNVLDPLDVINGMTHEGLLKRLRAGNLDPCALKIAMGKMKDYPCGIAEYGTDALRFALISYASQVCHDIFICFDVLYLCFLFSYNIIFSVKQDTF